MTTIFVTYLNSIFLNAVVLVFMLYIVYATLYGLFKIKLLGFYSLHKGQHTDGFSLVYSGSLLLKLGVPMCYNFLSFLRIENTVFQEFMG